MAGLGDEHRAAVAAPRVAQQVLQAAAACVAGMPAQPCAAGVQPLVAVVVVDAQHVQVARRASQGGFQAPAQHVPGFELRQGERSGLGGPLLRLRRAVCARIGPHVDQRIGVHHACPGLRGPQRIAASQGGLDQQAFEFVATLSGVAPVGMHQVGTAYRPAQEGDFVDRLEQRRAVAAPVQRARHLVAEVGEPGGELRGEEIYPRGQAVVVQGPDDLQAVLLRRIRQGMQPANVQRAAGRGACTPADALAHGVQAQPGQGGVVLGEQAGVAVAGIHVQRRAMAVHMVSAFEPPHPEGGKKRLRPIRRLPRGAARSVRGPAAGLHGGGVSETVGRRGRRCEVPAAAGVSETVDLQARQNVGQQDVNRGRNAKDGYFCPANRMPSAGRRSTKQAPWRPSGRPSQCTVASWRSAMERTSARPRPTPPLRSLAPGRR